MATASSERLQLEIRATNLVSAPLKKIVEDTVRGVAAIDAAFRALDQSAGGTVEGGFARAEAGIKRTIALEGQLANFRRRAAAELAKSGGDSGSQAAIAATLQQKAQAFALESAQRSAAASAGQLGAAIASEFGPAGQAVASITSEVTALGGGLDNLIGKTGLSRAALVGLGAAAAGLGVLVNGLSLAVDKSIALEESLRRARIASATLNVDPDALRTATRGVSARTGIPETEVGAAFSLAFEGGAKSVEQATRQVELAARALLDAGLGSSLPSSFDALKSASDAFGVSAEDALKFLNLIKVSASEAQTSPEKLLAAVSRSAVGIRALGFTAEDAFEIVARTAGKGGVAIEQAGLVLDEIVKTFSNPDDAGFKLLENFGIGLSRAELKAKGLKGAIDEVFDKVGSDPQDLSRIFATKNVGGIQAAVQPSGPELSGRIDAAGAGDADLQAAALARATSEAEKYQKATNRLGLAISSEGDKALTLWSDISDRIANDIALAQRLADEWKKLEQGAYSMGAAVRQALGFSGSAEQLTSAESERLDIAQQVTAELRAQEAALKSLLAAQEYVEGRKANPLTAPSAEAGLPPNLRGVDLDSAIESQRAKVAALAGDLEELRVFRTKVELAAPSDGEVNAIFAGARATALALFGASPLPLNLQPDVLALRDSIADALDDFDGREIPVQLKAQTDFLEKLLANPKELNFAVEDGAVAKALSEIAAYITAVQQAEAALAALRERGLSGSDRQRAETARQIADAEKVVATLKKQGVEERLLAAIRAELPGIRQGSEDKIARDEARETAESSARILGLKIQLIDRERNLAAAVGVTADSESEAAAALSERAKIQRDLALAQIAARRAQIDPKDTAALDALKSEENLLLRIADAESAAAAAAFDRSRIERGARTSGLVADAGDELLVGLDAQFAAIERNRAAKIKSAEDGVRSGQLDADALSRLIPLYDAIADREIQRAGRAAAQRDAEDIAGLIQASTTAYADQVGALELLRAVERDRYAEDLRNEGLLADAIAQRLALFDKATAKQKQGLAIQFSGTSSIQLAQQRLLEDAYRRIGDTGVDAYERIAEALAKASSGTDALLAGMRASLEDLRREFADDFGFGAKAVGETGRGFRDSLSSAFQGKRNDGESIGQTFLRSNLENVQKQAADFAANKVSALIFGAPEGNKPGTPDERMLVASETFAAAVDRFAAASPGANFALQPPDGAVRPFNVGEIGPGINGDPLAAPIGPQLPGAEDLSEAGTAAGDAMKTGAQAGAQAIINGGNVFGSLLTGVANSLGSALSGVLSGVATSALGFAEGGIVQGQFKAYTPHRAQYGRVVRQRSLIEVAENPGLEEAIIPLRGGAVPVRLTRSQDAGARRDSDRDATTELVQAMRGRAVAAERQANRQKPEKVGPTVNVAGSTVTLSVSIEGGGSGSAGQELLAAMPEIEKRLTAAIELGTNRRLINAIRGA